MSRGRLLSLAHFHEQLGAFRKPAFVIENCSVMHPIQSLISGLRSLVCGLWSVVFCALAFWFLVFWMAAILPGRAASPAATTWKEQVEADWLLQDAKRLLPAAAERKVSPEQDALGGCDGVKDGKWGFHTEAQLNPWWQVDLGRYIQAGAGGPVQPLRWTGRAQLAGSAACVGRRESLPPGLPAQRHGLLRPHGPETLGRSAGWCSCAVSPAGPERP